MSLVRNKKVKIRTDIIKFIHFSLLDNFTIDAVTKFWEHTCYLLGENDIPQFLQGIWQKQCKLPIEYTFAIATCFDEYAVEHEKDTKDIIQKTIIKNNGMIYGPGIVLWAMKPFLSMVYRTKDPREIILKFANTVNKRLRPDTFIKLLRFQKKENQNTGVIAWGVDEKFTCDSSMDGEVFGAVLMQQNPLKFNAPCFDSYAIIAERLTVCERLKNDGICEVKEKQVFHNNRLLGEFVIFGEYLESLELDTSSFTENVLKSEVILALEDRYSSYYKRNIIHKGAVYGAPFNIFQLDYSDISYDSTNSLDTLVDEGVEKDVGFAARMKNAHSSLLSHLSKKYSFDITYHKEHESIFINGERIAKGDVAYILYYMLRVIERENRHLFTNKEIIESDHFKSMISNSHFKTALNRLEQKLGDHSSHMKISSCGPGCFELQVHKTYTFTIT